MKQSQFEKRHHETWESFAKLLNDLEGNKLQRRRADIAAFGSLYRELCHLHAIAQARNYSRSLVDRLAELTQRGHQQFYRRRQSFFADIVAFLLAEFPVMVRRYQGYFWLATVLLYGPALILIFALQQNPALVYSVMAPEQVENFEGMYNPDHRIVGEARDSDTNWYMFGHYIHNNISIAFRTFASGLVWGIGALFILTYNGLAFGAVTGHLINVGYTETFFSFVVAHGSFELTAIVISGAAGFVLGESLLFPGALSRIAALRAAAHEAIKLMYGAFAMLVIAAFVEAFWSSNNLLPPSQKYAVGGALWLLVAAYLIWGGRRRGF